MGKLEKKRIKNTHTRVHVGSQLENLVKAKSKFSHGGGAREIPFGIYKKKGNNNNNSGTHIC